eukprot:jgi/Mesvir1/13786/Mv15952-RA.5
MPLARCPRTRSKPPATFYHASLSYILLLFLVRGESQPVPDKPASFNVTTSPAPLALGPCIVESDQVTFTVQPPSPATPFYITYRINNGPERIHQPKSGALSGPQVVVLSGLPDGVYHVALTVNSDPTAADGSDANPVSTDPATVSTYHFVVDAVPPEVLILSVDKDVLADVWDVTFASIRSPAPAGYRTFTHTGFMCKGPGGMASGPESVDDFVPCGSCQAGLRDACIGTFSVDAATRHTLEEETVDGKYPEDAGSRHQQTQPRGGEACPMCRHPSTCHASVKGVGADAGDAGDVPSTNSNVPSTNGDIPSTNPRVVSADEEEAQMGNVLCGQPSAGGTAASGLPPVDGELASRQRPVLHPVDGRPGKHSTARDGASQLFRDPVAGAELQDPAFTASAIRNRGDHPVAEMSENPSENLSVVEELEKQQLATGLFGKLSVTDKLGREPLMEILPSSRPGSFSVYAVVVDPEGAVPLLRSSPAVRTLKSHDHRATSLPELASLITSGNGHDQVQQGMKRLQDRLVERNVLLAIKSAAPPGAKRVSQWGPGDHCVWPGVTCVDGMVTELGLGGIGLTHLPPEIGELYRLQYLHLFENHLSGLPAELGKLQSLQHILLQYNNLTSLPPAVCQLSNLQTLQLGDNRIRQLGPELGKLRSLQHLFISSNGLERIPQEIGQLTKLRGLYLSGNKLIEVPAEIGRVRSMRELALQANAIYSLPPEIGQLDNLEAMFIGHNQLELLPPEIGQLSQLKVLYANHNKLKALPAEVELLSSLLVLDVSHNEALCGFIADLRLEAQVDVAHAGTGLGRACPAGTYADQAHLLRRQAQTRVFMR